MASPYASSDQEFYPGTRNPIPGGIKLLRGNVFERGRQMCAEFVNEKGIWEAKTGAANHGWDCSVYNLVAAEILGVRHWKKARGGDQRSEAGNQRKQSAEGRA